MGYYPDMINRNVETYIERVKKGFPIITITGPRQSGKTTLAKHLFYDLEYVSLEDPQSRQFALNDPKGFLNRYNKGAVFDEVQRCPDLFSYLQGMVDEDQKPGRFVLTGSQNFGLLSNITQSLAGRTALVTLLPFSISECYRDNLPDVDKTIFTGLYPPVHDREILPEDWYPNYVQTYLERDVRQIVSVKDLNTFQTFLRLCAARTAQLLNTSSLAVECGVSHTTVKNWISILEASYIIFRLQPHHSNFNKRLVKSPKIYFYDTGLVAWLLSIQNISQLSTHPMRGEIFETMIISEMVKSRFNQGRPSNLYFWRDYQGNEVDVIIDHGTTLIPLEIKSGKTFHPEFTKGIKKWSTLAGSLSAPPVLVYGGDESLHSSGVKVIPWNIYCKKGLSYLAP